MQGLRIRRKTRRNEISGRTIWWFVIHADEAVLSELDEKWDRVHVQTSWTLNQCTKPADTTVIDSEEAPTSHTRSYNHEQPPTPTHADEDCEASGSQQQDTEHGNTPISEDVETPGDPSFLDPTQDPTSAT